MTISSCFTNQLGLRANAVQSPDNNRGADELREDDARRAKAPDEARKAEERAAARKAKAAAKEAATAAAEVSRSRHVILVKLLLGPELGSAMHRLMHRPCPARSF